MKSISLLFALILITGVLFSSCATEAKEEKEPENLEQELDDVGKELEDVGQVLEKNLEKSMGDLEKSLDQLGKNLENINLNKDGEEYEVVNFRDLLDYLPTRLAGMKQQGDPEGETTKAFGFKFSQAEVTYKDGDRILDVTLIDSGGNSLASLGAAAWTRVELDKESSRGYERTTTYKGHKAFEKYDSKSKKGEFHVFVDDRYLISIEGRNIEADDLENARDDMNLRKLTRLGK